MTRKEVQGAAAIEVFNRAIKKCFYPVITDKPFDLNKPKISWVANGEPIPAGFRMPLTPDEFDTLRKAIPELTDARLEAFLRRLYNLGDARAAAMTFQQVFEFCKDAIRAEKQDDTPPAGGAAGKIEVRWQKIKIEAEAYIKDNDFPGIKPLAKILNCHRGTLSKAIDDSESLQNAKRLFDKRTPKAETLNNRVGKQSGGDLCDTTAKTELIQKIQKLVKKQTDSGMAAMVEKADLYKFSTEELEKMHEALKQTGLEFTDGKGNTRLSKRV